MPKKKIEESNADILKRAARELMVANPKGRAGGRGRGVARHNNARMLFAGCHPSQVPFFQQQAAAAGLTAVTYHKDGRCYCDDRRQEAELAFLRMGRFNQDGGYHETIRASRMRELDRIAGRS